MRELKKFLWLTLAGFFLFEAWLWDVLGAALASLVAVLPIKEARASFEGFVKNLSPWGSLPVFVLPILPLLPLKIAALFFIAHHQFVLGLSCFLAAKLSVLPRAPICSTCAVQNSCKFPVSKNSTPR